MDNQELIKLLRRQTYKTLDEKLEHIKLLANGLDIGWFLSRYQYKVTRFLSNSRNFREQKENDLETINHYKNVLCYELFIYFKYSSWSKFNFFKDKAVQEILFDVDNLDLQTVETIKDEIEFRNLPF
jgi:hypothetical protein